MFLNDVLDMKWEFKDSELNPFNYENIPTDETLIRVDVDNLDEYCIEHPKAGKISDVFGICLSPWEWAWTEYKCRRTHSVGKVGILHHTMMVDDPIAQLNKLTNLSKDTLDVLRETPPRFYSLANIFTYQKDLGQIRLLGEMWNMYDNDGQILNTCTPTSTYIDLNTSSKEEINKVTLLFTQLMYPSLFAFGLSHCKNIQIVTDQTDLSKPNIRRTNGNKSLLYQYKRVILSDGTQKKYQRGEIATDSDDPRSVSFHMCKGHFKTYTADSPLFGKLTGTFWVPQHTRGSKDVGTVVKNYTAKKA